LLIEYCSYSAFVVYTGNNNSPLSGLTPTLSYQILENTSNVQLQTFSIYMYQLTDIYIQCVQCNRCCGTSMLLYRNMHVTKQYNLVLVNGQSIYYYYYINRTKST